MVEGFGQGHYPSYADHPIGRLEAYHTTVGGRPSNRTSGIGPVRAKNHPGEHPHRRSGTRTVGYVVQIPRVTRSQWPLAFSWQTKTKLICGVLAHDDSSTPS